MDPNNTAPAAPAGDPLAAIAAEGAQLEQQQLPPAPGTQPEPEKISPAQMWAMVPKTLGSVLAMAFPELQKVYTEEVCNNWGEAMVPVAEKYGWSVGADSPEFGLFLASTPLLIGTGVVVMNHRRARQVKRPEGDQAAPAAPERKLTAADEARLPPQL